MSTKQASVEFDYEIAIAFNGKGKNAKAVEIKGFASVDDACEALLARSGIIWGVVMVGRPFNWTTLFKYSRQYGLRSVEEIERFNQDKKTKQTNGK